MEKEGSQGAGKFVRGLVLVAGPTADQLFYLLGEPERDPGDTSPRDTTKGAPQR